MAKRPQPTAVGLTFHVNSHCFIQCRCGASFQTFGKRAEQRTERWMAKHECPFSDLLVDLTGAAPLPPNHPHRGGGL